MYRVGVIGPERSVNTILATGEKMNSPLKLHPLIYETATQTAKIVEQHKEQFDYFLFSGIIPYMLGKSVITEQRAFYVELLESGVYRGLLNVMQLVNKPVSRLSIDIIQGLDVVERSIEQMEMKLDACYIEYFNPLEGYQHLLPIHRQRWAAKEVDAVLTCHPEIKNVLTAEGIPVEWISPTSLAIRQVIRTIEQGAETDYFKKTQIASCYIMIEDCIDEADLSFDIQMDTLEIQTELLHMSRKMNGSFFKVRDQHYMIISSRGEMLDYLKLLQEDILKLQSKKNRQIIVGIGFGNSALQAEQFARKAAQSSRALVPMIGLMNEDGEFLSANEAVAVSTKSHVSLFHTQIYEQLEQARLPVHHVEALYFVIRRKKWDQFTTQDVMLELQISHRVAQRLVKALVEINILEKIGDEKRKGKGRPNSLYCWNE